MRVLITNFRMAMRTGSELFVHDLALSLSKKGHEIIIYAPAMGELGEGLHMQSIDCRNELTTLIAKPDIIIGNSQYETVACLARFPTVPAISICHDSSAEQGSPPRFSRVFRYVAVDKNCSERLQRELKLPEKDITIIQNGVDLLRFQQGSPLPIRPLKAAIFSNYSTNSQETQIIQTICSEFNIHLDVFGYGVNNPAKNPEDILHQYDLVFAKARCAMEAMAVGCAVILLNEKMGMAGLVTSKNMKEWHSWNFGRRLLQQPINADNLREAIKSYSAEDAAIVNAYMRENATLEKMSDSFDNLAQTVIKEATTKEILNIQENKELALFIAEKLSLYDLSYQILENKFMEKLSLNDFSYQILENQFKDTHKQLKNAHEQIHLIYKSNSWRLTKPLRLIIDFIRKLK